jgi:hypothetical protein
MTDAHCRSCNAPIVWARTAFNGTPIPVDAVPVDDGNILLEEKGNGRLVALVLPPGDERITSQTTYLSHFATCPDGDQWRRRTHA